MFFEYLWSVKTSLGIQSWRFGTYPQVGFCFVLLQVLSHKESLGTMGSETRASQIRLEAKRGVFLEAAVLKVNLVGWIKVRPRRSRDDRSHNKLLAVCLSHSGCSHRTPQTKWLLNNNNLFVTVVEARSPRSRHCQIQCLLTGCFLVRRQPSFHWVLTR